MLNWGQPGLDKTYSQNKQIMDLLDWLKSPVTAWAMERQRTEMLLSLKAGSLSTPTEVLKSLEAPWWEWTVWNQQAASANQRKQRQLKDLDRETKEQSHVTE